MSIYQADPRYLRQKQKTFDDCRPGYSIYIPRAYARGESKNAPKDAKEVPHYELFIDRQLGTSYSNKPTNIYWKLPKSGKYIAIELFRDGGVDYKPGKEHTYAIRETDELDRRIVFGFCKLYRSSLIDACHTDEEYNLHLVVAAKYYKADSMPKRIKLGKSKSDFPWFYDTLLEPYDESNLGIFKNLQFI